MKIIASYVLLIRAFIGLFPQAGVARSSGDQLRPSLAKTTYCEGLMELKAPHAGTVKD
jgi:hypothetical protein